MRTSCKYCLVNHVALPFPQRSCLETDSSGFLGNEWTWSCYPISILQVLFGKSRHVLVLNKVTSIYCSDMMLHRLSPIKFSARKFDVQLLQVCSVKHAHHHVGNDHCVTLFCEVSLTMRGVGRSCRCLVNNMTPLFSVSRLRKNMTVRKASKINPLLCTFYKLSPFGTANVLRRNPERSWGVLNLTMEGLSLSIHIYKML